MREWKQKLFANTPWFCGGHVEHIEICSRIPTSVCVPLWCHIETHSLCQTGQLHNSICLKSSLYVIRFHRLQIVLFFVEIESLWNGVLLHTSPICCPFYMVHVSALLGEPTRRRGLHGIRMWIEIIGRVERRTPQSWANTVNKEGHSYTLHLYHERMTPDPWARTRQA